MKIKNIVRKKYVSALFIGTSLVLVACDADNVGNYNTFTGETVGQYLEARPESFSEFCSVLDTTKVMSLLKAYGSYTCFAPTNEAMQKLYDDYNVTSYRQLKEIELKKIANDHIIKDYTIRRSDFKSGRLSQKTMSDRYVSMSLDGTGSYFVNETSRIDPLLSADSIHNGVVYALELPLQPTEMNLAELIEHDAKAYGRFTIFARALKETLLSESLKEVQDESYDPTIYEAIEPDNKWPQAKKFGYTALIESDSVYLHCGVVSQIEDEDLALEELKSYAKSIYDNTYPEDAGKYDNDLTHSKNPLNRFIAYHLHDKQMNREFYTEKHFDKSYTQSMGSNAVYTEYVETMCDNTLMGVTYKSAAAKNVINNSDVTFLPGYTDKDAINGVYHELTGVLVYDKKWISEMTSTRMRMDVCSFYPELTNNGYRYDKQGFRIPKGYIKGLEFDDNSKLKIIGPNDTWRNLCGDEMWADVGSYDVSITTLAIPKGVYEVRMGYQANAKRGVVQIYWDGKPCGIPLDMNITSADPSIGYEIPGSVDDDPMGYENDKMMRNRGYMKAPSMIYTTHGGGKSVRYDATAIRRILGIFEFQEDAKHSFRMKSVKEGEFMIDYFEFVPTEYLEFEGID